MVSIPYRGSKRYSYNKQVKPIAIQGGYVTVLEPFGGSAVLSVNLKRDGIMKKAVINDYDHLWDIYPEYLDIKDELVGKCRRAGLVKCVSTSRGKYLLQDDGTKTPVKSCLLDDDGKQTLRGFVAGIDRKWWPFLSLDSCFTFEGAMSQTKVYLKSFKYFRNGLETDKAREYLKAVGECEVMNLDWRDFLEANKGCFGDKTLIILDPPYTDANPGVYKSEEPYTLDDLRGIVSAVKDTGCDFILFNYNMEDIRGVLSEFGLEPDRLEYTGLSGDHVARKSRDVLAYVRRNINE